MGRPLANRLKVGIVGCGFIAKKQHIPAFHWISKCLQDMLKNSKREGEATALASGLSSIRVNGMTIG